MSILREFERSLGGDPEPVLRRLVRAGLRPVELAKALREYLHEQQAATDDGVLVPNVFRITLGTADNGRLGRHGVSLPRGLATVVVETAAEQGWTLLGPVKVRIERDDLVPAGTFRLTGHTEAVEGWGPASAPTPAPADGVTAPGAGVTDPTLEVRTGVDAGARVVLGAGRVVAGRGTSCDLVVRDTTVSREHAAFVRRGDAWWVIDLGSTNGTRVNGVRAAEHPIIPGDRIELGDVVVELVEA